jgi:hypothetical protein
MDIIVKGARLVDADSIQIIVSYHDECCAQASEYSKFAWKIDGQGGQLKDKSRGPCCMVAGYLTFTTPGKDKDPWWDGEQPRIKLSDTSWKLMLGL